ncbi:site-specific DNA-methyltransferase [Bacteroides ovatus]|jgi:DNA modification methylase|uniref:DNA-methyltransferase n=1 Tax=Bacteroides ovatus TaxID=28116 RepID=UPI000EE08B2C|nr:site-specific DNA-methyltransferase [Bacteroides ovatus]MDC2772821.1 site-specific DNA-methyltransferase [Bacteroides ovatus]MDC2784553.1 site-specific DNA-methyltransferase [Bacteroides ovatus]MDC2789487.1 site-specific DNA-methyltransferase [Bacteroides ovatus]MDC2794301.1 site-specific DNA-methyltransferase [Bacteroides ovatus]MDC2799159.1 site-specific DNA-methyltransferase [Bacteroides ovatus]
MEKLIEVFNLGSLPTAPLDSFLELQEDFKKSDPDKLSKLQMLIITRGFKYAFKAWKDPDGKLWIIDAHQRRKALLALRKSGFTIPEIPYEPIFAADKKEAVEEIAAYNSEFATKNPDTLLFKKYDIDGDTMERFNLGYEVKAVDYSIATPLFAQEHESENVQEDVVDFSIPSENEDSPGSVFAQSGDIWLLGNTRLMCGDCRSKTDVSALMNGQYADLLVTDPPYNVAYQGATEDELTIQNDSMENDLFATFLRQVFTVMFSILKPGGAYYVFHADSEGENFRASLRKVGFKISQCCVWVKNSMVMGRQDYQWQHEPCLYGWKPGAGHFWNSDRKQTTVWNFDKPQRNAIHPTMKPIALMAYPICNSSLPGQIVADFFSGSGSTLMACQQTDRICCAMEIDPRYVSATVSRYRTMFPEQPVRLIRGGELMNTEETLKLIA